MLHAFIPQLVLVVVGIVTAQLPDFALGFLEPHEVLLGSDRVSLDSIPSFRFVDHILQLGASGLTK